MNTLRDWDKFYKETNGLSGPQNRVTAAQEPVLMQADGIIEQQSVVGSMTGDVRTRELNALAQEDLRMYGLDRKRCQASALYIALDQDIAACEYPVAQGRMTRWGDVAEEEIRAGTQRYMRRGTGIAEETFTVQATHRGQRY